MNFPINLLLFLSVFGHSFATWHHIRDWIFPVKSAANKSEAETTTTSVFADSTIPVDKLEGSTVLPTSYSLELTTKTAIHNSELETTSVNTVSASTLTTSTGNLQRSTMKPASSYSPNNVIEKVKNNSKIETTTPMLIESTSMPISEGSTNLPNSSYITKNTVEKTKNESKIETSTTKVFTSSSSSVKLNEPSTPSASHSPKYTDKIAKNDSKVATTPSTLVGSTLIGNSTKSTALPVSTSYSSSKFTTTKTVKNKSKEETSTVPASSTGPTPAEKSSKSTALQTSSYSPKPKLAEIKWDDEARGWKCRSQSNVALPCPKEEIDWLKNI